MAGHGYHWENALAGVLASVTTNDSTDLPKLPTSGLYIGTGGDLKVNDMDGQSVTLKNVASGQILPLKVSRVSATGTSGQDTVALY